MQKVVFDCNTGKSQYIDLTPEEIEAFEAESVAAEQRKVEEEAAAAALAATKESARAKLAALGLTEAEVAALVK